MNYSYLAVLSLVPGLIAWLLPIINLAIVNKTKYNNWPMLSIASVSICAISICMRQFYSNHLVNMKDWAALMDTSPFVTYVSLLLVAVTIALNAITVIIYHKKTDK